jgi:amidase
MLDVFSVSISATVGLFLTPETIELLQPYSRFLLERGNGISSAQLVSALSRLAAASGQALSSQQEFDVLITPTTTRPQVAVDEFWLDFGEQSFAAMAQWARFVGVANCTGQPAISVPVGIDDAGLPQGVQLLAGRGHDRTLLHLAAQLEDALPWSQRRPQLARSGSSVRLGSPEE